MFDPWTALMVGGAIVFIAMIIFGMVEFVAWLYK